MTYVRDPVPLGHHLLLLLLMRRVLRVLGVLGWLPLDHHLSVRLDVRSRGQLAWTHLLLGRRTPDHRPRLLLLLATLHLLLLLLLLLLLE